MPPHPSNAPSFVVPLRDLDDGPKKLIGEISQEWLREALAETEASPGSEAGRLSLELSKNGREVLVRGNVQVQVVVPCARTLAPITLELAPELLLLLERAEGPANPRVSQRARAGGRGERAQREPREHRPRDRKVGAPARRRGGWEHAPELSSQDAALDTFEGEQITLDPFVREFILLELPMFPVRQDLPSLPVNARASAPGSAGEPTASGNGPADSKGDATPLDPRLAPLAELKDRLRQNKKDKE